MRRLRWLGLLVAFCACLAPMAHVMELPNKLRLEGPLWLAVQQHLYNGWGPLIGAPTEIGGLVISAALVAIHRKSRPAMLLYGLATIAYCGMLLSFFLLNKPVNEALNGWTAQTLPVDWDRYRLQWEIGHAVAALLAIAAFLATAAAALAQKAARPADVRRARQRVGKR
jgi:hypothetical protein